jgi:rare lipoprotein A
MRVALAMVSLLALAACAGDDKPAPGRLATGGAPAKGPATQGYYKVGNPYQVEGVWYAPREDLAYDESGIASWYGPGFHAKYTANGEVYDQNDVTAAHKTLPMPSLVRVTNLDNGRSLVVRVNDRGPFVSGRIIDLSHRSAQLLGVDRVGTAKVRVSILSKESVAIKEAAMRGKPTGTVVASAPVPPSTVEPGGRDVEKGVLPQQLNEPVVAAVPAVDEKKAMAQASTGPAVAGSSEGGRFLPAAKVQQLAVKQTGIYVQAGAFSVLDNAEKLRQQLSRVGAANISTVNVGGRQFHRVRIGPIANVDQADTVLGKVLGSGVTDAKIVAE